MPDVIGGPFVGASRQRPRPIDESAVGRLEGPQAVDAGSPLGRLQGTDNLVEFHTNWYRPAPLVVQGRGAGTDATAAGVLAEMVELATGL